MFVFNKFLIFYFTLIQVLSSDHRKFKFRAQEKTREIFDFTSAELDTDMYTILCERQLVFDLFCQLPLTERLICQ